MIASLPMYDRAETAGANDRLWALIRARLGEAGIDAPETLTRGRAAMDVWRAPDLALSQTCGLPFRAGLHEAVTLVATPVHDLGARAGHYTSVIVARDAGRLADMDGARLAYNDAMSQSGWAAFWTHAPGFRPGALVETGAHRASARAVAEGRADVAALDAVSWDMMREWDDFAQRLVVIAETAETPALPYICGPRVDPVPLRHALGAAIAALAPVDRASLRLTGLAEVPAADYRALALPPSPASIAMHA